MPDDNLISVLGADMFDVHKVIITWHTICVLQVTRTYVKYSRLRVYYENSFICCAILIITPWQLVLKPGESFLAPLYAAQLSQ